MTEQASAQNDATLAIAPAAAIPREYNFAADILRRNLDAGRADKPAFVDPHRSLTYGELAERVARFAGGLLALALGLRRDERVLIALTDTVDWPTAFLGALWAGAVAVPVNTLMTEGDYRFMLADSRARGLIVSDALLAKFAPLLAGAADLAHVIVSGGDGVGHIKFDDVVAQSMPGTPPAATCADEIAFWLYTSGSTGKPKGAVHVHADLKLTDDLYGRPFLAITENDICYSVAKLFFAYGLGNALTFPMSAGATTILLDERPVPDSVAALLARHAVTVFYAVPTFYAAFLASPAMPARNDLHFRTCVSAGEALPEDIGLRWREATGADILDGLGSTEMLHIFLSNRAGEVRYGTTGRAVPGYDLRLVADDGSDAPSGEMGELWVRGPTSAVCYWNNRAQSRTTFVGEWTRSGDKYRQDAEGHYVYCGRRDDMLKVSGLYVSPCEVEGALMTHPDVLEAAVVGWADADDLIKPKAFVVLRTPASVPADGQDQMSRRLQEHVKSRLAPYKYPRWIEYRAELPKTATGKIQRFKLRGEGRQLPFDA